MENRKEDDLLRPLFGKIRMEKAPDSITTGVMDRIMVNPEIYPAGRIWFEWWWVPVGVLGVLAIYLTGVLSMGYKILEPYFIMIFKPLSEYVSGIAELLPSQRIMVTHSYLLPVFLAGILLVLIIDVILEQELRTAVNK